jgi:hypothetical protein
VGAEIIEQRAGDGGFSDTALVSANENDCGSGHRGYSEKLIKKGAASRIQSYATPVPAVNNDRIDRETHAFLGHSPAWVKNLCREINRLPFLLRPTEQMHGDYF